MAYTLTIGDQAPDFDLIGTDVDYYSLDSFKDFDNLIILILNSFNLYKTIKNLANLFGKNNNFITLIKTFINKYLRIFSQINHKL